MATTSPRDAQRAAGTTLSSWASPPTGRAATISGICISRCSHGKIVEEWEISDALGALRQVGGLPETVES